jgi:hypothetical protein
VHGCQIGTECPILHANQDQVYAAGFSDGHSGRPVTRKPYGANGTRNSYACGTWPGEPRAVQAGGVIAFVVLRSVVWLKSHVAQVGGVIAFAMVWTEFKVIQETSALTFMIAGTFKEIVTGGLRARRVEHCSRAHAGAKDERVPHLRLRHRHFRRACAASLARSPLSSLPKKCLCLPACNCLLQHTVAMRSFLAPTRVPCAGSVSACLLQHTVAMRSFLASTRVPSARAVFAAVMFLGETFTLINMVGLATLIAGVVLFNYIKWKKIHASPGSPGELQSSGSINSVNGRKNSHSEDLSVRAERPARGRGGDVVKLDLFFELDKRHSGFQGAPIRKHKSNFQCASRKRMERLLRPVDVRWCSPGSLWSRV